MCLAVALLAVAFVIGEVASIAMMGSHVGTGPTLAAVAVAGVLGAVILSGRGVTTFKAAADAYRNGEPVGQVVASGALVALAGALLITPGLLSDAIALLILVPPIRAVLARRIVARIKARAAVVHPSGAPFIDAEASEKPGDPPASLP